MRGPWIVVAALVAVVGVAWLLFGRDSDAPSPATGPAASPTKSAAADDDESARSAVGAVRGGIKPARASQRGDARERGGPPPKPEPTMSLDKARRELAAVFEELDDAAAAGRRLPTKEWTDLYKRGNDALMPLQQHLDWSVPEEADEMRKAQDDFRAKIRAVEPRPSP